MIFGLVILPSYCFARERARDNPCGCGCGKAKGKGKARSDDGKAAKVRETVEKDEAME